MIFVRIKMFFIGFQQYYSSEFLRVEIEGKYDASESVMAQELY